jgi:hypothetical protein
MVLMPFCSLYSMLQNTYLVVLIGLMFSLFNLSCSALLPFLEVFQEMVPRYELLVPLEFYDR